MAYNKTESYNMSTITTQLIINQENSTKASEEVKEELISIEKRMSFFLENSDISKINRNSGLLGKVVIHPDTLEVIEKSIEYSRLTDGAFDITLAPVIREWGIFSDHERIPDNETLEELIKLVGYQNIYIDKLAMSVGLKYPGQKIDLGAIAKGYATDKAIEIYRKYGISSAMINIGGNVTVLGGKENGEPWAVGIQNPESPRGETVGVLLCEDTSVVTSGNYVRNFSAQGNVYGHIIETRTGIPVQNDLASVTVVCDSAIKADALSTAIFTMGIEKGLDFIRTVPDICAILITDQKEIYISSGLKDKFYLEDQTGFRGIWFS
ncbi:FAD:protein FMN transferase [Anaeromicropila herbilytica]|uniref:FAD:protein FMN transferase n=1 Tax=Anaeromicropila herbilytica TaxID=2785025 RepID=A0A7R7ICI6_9FIRM|nr:FAD:protein FMN transferase [Anaeromicropila herbilytica]BCN29901.1 FAD:protein FMN transferase [Anaeromicropila herbilytica]